MNKVLSLTLGGILLCVSFIEHAPLFFLVAIIVVSFTVSLIRKNKNARLTNLKRLVRRASQIVRLFLQNQRG